MQFCSQLGVSMLSAYCCFYLLFRLLGCAPSKINTIKNKLYFIHMKRNTASHRNPGKSSYPLPPRKKTLSARHALNTARIAPRPRPQCSDGLPLQKTLNFAQTARVRRDVIENRRQFHYNYTRTFSGSMVCSGYNGSS